MMPPNKAYDETGALGGLFAPAYIHGDPQAEAAVQKWQADNFGMTNPGVDATRGPSTTVPTTTGFGIRNTAGTMTLPGMVDPEALRALAQGGKYVDQRDKIAAQVLANQGGGALPGAGGGGGAGGGAGVPGMPGSLRGGGEMSGMLPIGFNTMTPEQQARYGNQGFMQGSWAGGA
jgi:hypothetical protein